MAHLHELLQKTLLLTAHPALEPRDNPNFSVPKVPDVFQHTVQGYVGASPHTDRFGPGETAGLSARYFHYKKLWHYEWDPSRLTEITDLTARNRMMGEMEMPVCKRIEWGPVRIQFRGNLLELPLTSDYLVETYFLDGGEECREGEIRAGASSLWPLANNLHHSHQLVFAYQMPFDRSSGAWQKPSKEEYSDWNFFRAAHADDSRFPIQGTAGPGYCAVEVQLETLRVIAVVTLGLATERDNFDPGGILGAARVYPVIMVAANLPLERVDARIEIERPTQTMHTQMGDDEMVADIGAIFVADKNPGSGFPAPYWDKIFGYYDMEPEASDRFAAVKRVASSEPRELKDAIEVLTSDSVVASNHYESRPLVKMPGQAEFDSVHLAPKMKPPDKVLYSVADDEVRKQLHKITMAPFCAHDCLHMHWRWSQSFDQKHTMGWDEFAPYSKAGAPLVPPNQDVQVRLLGAGRPGIEYVATAHDAKAGHWQVFFHHGMGYSISTGWTLTKLAKLATKAFADDNPLCNTSWWSVYFHLRYEYVPHLERDLKVRYLERILPGGEKGRSDRALRHERLKRVREF